MPNKLNYGPRLEKVAMRPPEADAKINILVGSVRSGKTFALHAKILYLCNYDVGGRRFMTGVSKASIKTNVLTDLFDLVGSKNYHYNSQSGELSLFNSDWLVYGAKDEGSEKYLRGATIGAAVCDEAVLMPQSYWQMLLTRMSPPGARLYATTNSDTSEHWLKRQYLDNQELIDDGTLWWDSYTMADNPNLDPSYIESQKKLYTGVFYDRMILGLWNMAGGACYADCWGPWTLYDEATRPRGLYGQGGYADHLIGVDYGTVNPCVFVDVIDDGSALWVDNEYYWDSKKEQRQKVDAEYARDLAKFIDESNCKQAPKILIDPSAASFRAELNMRGDMWVVECNNDVIEGIRRTSSALKQKKLRFHKDKCPNSLREHVGYAWDAAKAKLGKEEPVKRADHTCDGVRYVVNEVFKFDWRLMS
jgi:PBSX family phage terminase large subunit